MTFKLHAPGAKSVSIAGEFNGWDAAALPMKTSSNGDWIASTRLPAGDYGYKFVVDGKWIFDPAHTARKFVDHLENSRLVVRQPEFNSSTTPSSVAQQSALVPQVKPSSATWDHGSYQRASTRYNDALTSFQQYLQKRSDPSSLKAIETALHSTVDDFAKIRDGAPSKYNIQGMIDRCNKLIFDVHSTMQVSR